MRFFGFFSKTTRLICAIFFSGFRRKHLFITTCVRRAFPVVQLFSNQSWIF